MKSSIKFSIIFFLCISSINSECATGNEVEQINCDSSCTWEKVTDASCGGTSETCSSIDSSDTCTNTEGCTWTSAKGTCTETGGSESGTESGTGSGSGSGSESGTESGSGSGSSSSSGSSNNTSSSDDDGAFGLKSYIFSFFLIFLF